MPMFHEAHWASSQVLSRSSHAGVSILAPLFRETADQALQWRQIIDSRGDSAQELTYGESWVQCASSCVHGCEWHCGCVYESRDVLVHVVPPLMSHTAGEVDLVGFAHLLDWVQSLRDAAGLGPARRFWYVLAGHSACLPTTNRLMNPAFHLLRLLLCPCTAFGECSDLGAGFGKAVLVAMACLDPPLERSMGVEVGFQLISKLHVPQPLVLSPCLFSHAIFSTLLKPGPSDLPTTA